MQLCNWSWLKPECDIHPSGSREVFFVTIRNNIVEIFAMAGESKNTLTYGSCATLEDGIQHMQLSIEEQQLMKELQDSSGCCSCT